MGIGSVSERIARYAIESAFEETQSELHIEQQNILTLSLMDWIAVGRAGIDEPVSGVVRSVACAEGGREQASIFGSPKRLSPRLAAQVNGTTSHALDYDDTHFLHVGHTSVVVFSAAFAIGESQPITLNQLMHAVLAGSEVCCHLGQWLGRSHYQAGFHQTATAGIFGATATACRLLNVDVDTTLHALGLATTMASGLTSQFGTMGKPFNAGMAAANGVEAAILAASGFKSRQDAMQCAQGFAESHFAESVNADSDMFKLGIQPVFSDVQHKYHACCHGLHASLEALTHLRSTRDINPDAIKRIVITTNPRWLSVCNIATPATGLESKFSYRHVAALLFTNHDTSALSAYSDTLCSNKAVAAFRDKVQVEGLSELTDTQTQVQIELHSGVVHEAAFDLADPLPLPVRQKKLLSKCESLLGVAEASALWKLLQSGRELSAAQFASTAINGELMR